MKSNLAACLSNLGRGHQIRGQVDLSEVLFKEAVKLHRETGYKAELLGPLVALYMAYRDLGNTLDALRTLDELATILGNDPSTHVLDRRAFLVDGEMRFGDTAKARSMAEESLNYLAGHPGAHRAFGCYITALIADGAIEVAENWLKKLGSNYSEARSYQAHLNYLYGVSHFHYARNELGLALDALRQYVAITGLPAASGAAFDLVWVTLELGDLSSAAEIAAQIPHHMTIPLGGKIASARLRYQNAESVIAEDQQTDLVTLFAGRTAQPYMGELLEFYRLDRQSSRGASSFPRLKLLPSGL